MILYNEIIFQLREIVYIRVDYIGLSKGRSFIIIRVYSITSNIILDFIIFKIVILINPIKKALKIDKDIYIVTIYEYTDTMYFIIGSSKVFVILIVILITISELLLFI